MNLGPQQNQIKLSTAYKNDCHKHGVNPQHGRFLNPKVGEWFGGRLFQFFRFCSNNSRLTWCKLIISSLSFRCLVNYKYLSMMHCRLAIWLDWCVWDLCGSQNFFAMFPDAVIHKKEPSCFPKSFDILFMLYQSPNTVRTTNYQWYHCSLELLDWSLAWASPILGFDPWLSVLKLSGFFHFQDDYKFLGLLPFSISSRTGCEGRNIRRFDSVLVDSDVVFIASKSHKEDYVFIIVCNLFLPHAMNWILPSIAINGFGVCISALRGCQSD